MMSGLFILLLFGPLSAQAACSSPAGTAGQFQWIPGVLDYQFCDGNAWNSLNVNNTFSSCSTPGLIQYNSSDMQFCDGTQWVSTTGTQTNGVCSPNNQVTYSPSNKWMQWCNAGTWDVMQPASGGAWWVQSTEAATIASSAFITASSFTSPPFPSNPSPGNMIYCAFQYNSATLHISSVTDTAGNSYNHISSQTFGGSFSIETWYAQNISTSTNGIWVTANLSGSSSLQFGVSCHEYTGIATTNALDQSTTASGSTASMSVGPVTTTSAREIVIAATQGATESTGAGFNNRSILLGDVIEDKFINSAGSNSAAASETSGNWNMSMATFRVAGSQPKIAWVQSSESTSGTNSGTTYSIPAFATNPTAHDLMVCKIEYDTPSALSVTSVTDTGGNSYASVNAGASGLGIEVWYAQNIATAASFTVTVHFAGTQSGQFAMASCHEYSGVAQTNALDRSGFYQSANNIQSVGPVTTTGANDLALIVTTSGVVFAPTGYNTRSSLGGNLVEDKIVASAGSFTGTVNAVAPELWQTVLATFKAQGGTPTWIQKKETTTSSTSATTLQTGAFGTNPVTGHLIACFLIDMGYPPPAASSVTDTAGNTYSKAGAVGSWFWTQAGMTYQTTELWYAQNITGGSSFKVTAHFSAALTGGFAEVSCHEYSNVATASALDQVATTQGSNPTTAGPLTPTFDKELVFVGANAPSVTAAPSFSTRSSLNSDLVADRLVNSNAPVYFFGGPNGGSWWNVVIGTFRSQ